MSGLENIISQITAEAQATADAQISEARQKAQEVLDAAKTKAQKQAEAIVHKGTVDAEDVEKRALSSAQLESRNQLLAFKQAYIDQLIQETCDHLNNAPENVYFAYLIQLLKRFSRKEPGKLLLNQRDLDRLPSGFPKMVDDATGVPTEISKQAAEIDGGFLLVYEGIDLNCTFAALFSDRIDELRDIAGKQLFPDE